MNVSFGQLGSYVFNNPILLPTPPQQLPPPKPSKSKDTSYVYKLSRDQCQETLEKWVGDQCCKGSRAAKQGHLTDVWTYNALEVR